MVIWSKWNPIAPARFLRRGCSTEALVPVTGPAMQVHHRDDPDLIGFIEVADRIREAPGETAARRWFEFVELARVRADRRDDGSISSKKRLPSSGWISA